MKQTLRSVPADHLIFSFRFRFCFTLNGLYSDVQGLAGWSDSDFLSNINGYCTQFLKLSHISV